MLLRQEGYHTRIDGSMHPNFDARSFSIRALHDTTCAAWCAHTIDDRTSRLFCCCILRQNRVKSYAQLVQISFNVSWRLVFIPSRYAGLCLEHISITAVEFSKSCIFFFFPHIFTFQPVDKPWSQVSSHLPPGSYLQFFIVHRGQQSRCSSIFHRVYC